MSSIIPLNSGKSIISAPSHIFVTTNSVGAFPVTVMTMSGGNVGIGSTAPAQALDVSGAIAVSGTTLVDANRNISGGTGTFTGSVNANGDVVAFTSDDRLKTKLGNIKNALEKVNTLNGFRYNHNAVAKNYMFNDTYDMVGVSAQEVQRIMPEVVTIAPFDRAEHSSGSNLVSKSGENYLTVKYDKLVPLLVEAIKELSTSMDSLSARMKTLETI